MTSNSKRRNQLFSPVRAEPSGVASRRFGWTEVSAPLSQAARLLKDEVPEYMEHMGETNVCSPHEIDLSLRHLEAELMRLDVLLHRENRRWQMAGQDPADTFRGLYVSEAEVDGLLARPFGCNWGQTVTLPPEEARAFDDVLIHLEHTGNTDPKAETFAGLLPVGDQESGKQDTRGALKWLLGAVVLAILLVAVITVLYEIL